MQRPKSARTASIGVTRTRLAVEEELNWIFREQPTDDYGIDAQVEIVDDTEVVPKLLALQIKSGESSFDEPGLDGWWFRPKARHVSYWTNHVLPVVVILVHPVTKKCHWQLVTARTLVKAGTGWKVLVPENQVLNEAAGAALREAADGDPYVLRIRELQLARPWMMLLAEGRRLLIDIEEWVNKSSGRGSISLTSVDDANSDVVSLADWSVWLGPSGYADVIPRLFAWANVDIHAETYDDADYEQYQNECVRYDNEGDRFAGESFEDWAAGRQLDGLRPYANSVGEVDHWRLQLTLNQLGRAFLVVDTFATNGSAQLTK